jgi:hypothetical protein
MRTNAGDIMTPEAALDRREKWQCTAVARDPTCGGQRRLHGAVTARLRAERIERCAVPLDVRSGGAIE